MAPSSDAVSFPSVLSLRSLARCPSFLKIPLSRKFLSFVQRQEACERLKVLTIEVASLKWSQDKLAQAGSSLGDFSASSTFSCVINSGEWLEGGSAGRGACLCNLDNHSDLEHDVGEN